MATSRFTPLSFQKTGKSSNFKSEPRKCTKRRNLESRRIGSMLKRGKTLRKLTTILNGLKIWLKSKKQFRIAVNSLKRSNPLKSTFFEIAFLSLPPKAMLLIFPKAQPLLIMPTQFIPKLEINAPRRESTIRWFSLRVFFNQAMLSKLLPIEIEGGLLRIGSTSQKHPTPVQ